MPGRILLILILIAIVILAFRRLKRLSSRPKAGMKTTIGHMVQCATCGLYLPEQEAISYQGKYYCSQTHRDEDKS